MMIRILFITIFCNLFLFSSHKVITEEEWHQSTSKIKLEKQLKHIVTVSKKPIFHLRIDLLEDAIAPLVDSPEIKAVIITDNFSKIPFLTAYKEKNEIRIELDKKGKELDVSQYFILESKIIYENTPIASVTLYIYRNKIHIPDKKDFMTPINLSREEFSYLEEKKTLKICAIPNALPYEMIDENNKHLGIFSDIRKLIEKEIHTNIAIVKTSSFTEAISYIKERKCDILTGAMKTPARVVFLNFTQPYLREPLVIATNNKKIFINSVSELFHKKVGITKGYAFFQELKNKYPNIYFVEVKDAMDGLEKTQNNQLFAYIDTLPSISYNIQNQLFTNLKISGKLEQYIEFRTASRSDEPILNSILQKAHNSISQNTKESILKKWSEVKIKQTVDYHLLQEITVLFITILILTFFWTRKLSRTNKKLEKVTIDLEVEHQKAVKYANELQSTVHELEVSNQKLKVLASTDSMTGLFNRGYFKKTSKHFFSLAKRNQTDLSVLILDIDNFKNINDTYGHHIGDEVIIALAKNIKNLHRESDLSCRFGGEEFAILLPSTTIENALLLAEKIRVETENIKILLANNEVLQFTISIGVSLIHVENENDIEDSIKRADKALYEAKKSGKNKVCVYN